MHSSSPTCRKCDCRLERVRRSFIERLCLVRAAYECSWCQRRRRRLLFKPREQAEDYGQAVTQGAILNIRSDEADRQPAPKVGETVPSEAAPSEHVSVG